MGVVVQIQTSMLSDLNKFQYRIIPGGTDTISYSYLFSWSKKKLYIENQHYNSTEYYGPLHSVCVALRCDENTRDW